MSNEFHDVRFPTSIALGASGGPVRRTQVLQLRSGHEQRNTRWRHSRRRYNAGTGVKTLSDLHTIISFFEERRGRLHSFRWPDPLDHKSTSPHLDISYFDQALAIADGAQTVFQLTKRYGDLHPYIRPITKPIEDTVVIAVDGVQTSDFHVNATDGTIHMFAPPAQGASLTAGYHFDLEARFDTDELMVDLSTFKAGSVPEIPILEVLA